MTEAEIFGFIQESIIVLLKVVGPYLIVALVVGVIISILQTITSIQEQTLTFVPKFLVFFVMVIFMLPINFAVMKGYFEEVMSRISNIQ